MTDAEVAALPLWAVLMVLMVGFAAAVELGFVAHRRFGRGGRASETGDEAQVLATALLLLALLLGFTFSMALARYDNREALVVEEANDIETAWARAGLYETPAGQALQQRLAAYARTRIGTPDRSAAERLRAAAALRTEIWRLTRLATAPARETAQAASLVAAVNTVFETATRREDAAESHVPATVVMLLIAYGVVSTFLLGYVLGATGSRHRLAAATLVVLLAVTVVLILDLDRPRGGTIRISQQAMIALAGRLAPAP